MNKLKQLKISPTEIHKQAIGIMMEDLSKTIYKEQKDFCRFCGKEMNDYYYSPYCNEECAEQHDNEIKLNDMLGK